MKIFTQRLNAADLTTEQQDIIATQKKAKNFLCLDFDTRQRSRFKAHTQQNEAVGIDLPRTETIKNGSVLADNQGNVIQIMAANQALIEVTANDGFDLMKGAYHLGNRHVPLMITPKALYFEPDHVLESMLNQLGLHIQAVQAPFEPETGAYKGGHGVHSHAHSHAHSHGHDHAHSHEHNLEQSNGHRHAHSLNHGHSHD